MNENQTFFTEVQIYKTKSNINMDFIITPNTTSKMILNLLTLVIICAIHG